MSEQIQAISQGNYILATQQEVSHDNSLSGKGTVESPLGLNEAVLWSGVSSVSASPHCLVSESPMNFEYVSIFGRGYPTHKAQLIAQIDYNDIGASEDQAWVIVPAVGANGAALRFNQFGCSATDTEIYVYSARQFSLQGAAASTGISPSQITKIIGVNRKAQ